jgi:hypothetical protein
VNHGMEHMKVSGRRLGLRQPKNAPRLRMSRLLSVTAPLPEHPAAADHLSLVEEWGLYANDQFGDCGPVSVANDIKLATKYLTGTQVDVSLDDVFDLYRRSGNPGFDPKTGADDNGVDMQTMLEALLEGGIAGMKPVAFASVDHTSRDMVDTCISIFGSVLFGAMLDTAQMHQTDDGLWDFVLSAPWGGHAFLGGRYFNGQEARTGVVTWGEVVDATDAFLDKQLLEAWVVIWPWHLNSKAFQEGVDIQALKEDYLALTGRELVVPPFPGPQPTPEDPAVAADLALVTAADRWLKLHHYGHSYDMEQALRAWKLARGFH